MRSDRELLERYSDVLEPGDDPGLLRLVRDLDLAYPAARYPESLGSLSVGDLAARSGSRGMGCWMPRWAPAVTPRRSVDSVHGASGRDGGWRVARGSAGSSPFRRNLGRLLGASGMAAFAGVVALVVVMMATVLPGIRARPDIGAQPERIWPARTAAPISPDLKAALDNAFERNPYTREVMGKGLGREMSLAQTIDGYTLTVARAYADSKYIWIGLVAEGPEGRPVADIHLDDITYDGSPSDDLAWSQEEVAVATLAGDPDRRLEPGPTHTNELGLGKAFMLGFVTPELELGTKRLDLRLELAGLVAREAAGGRSPSSVRYGAGCEEVVPAVRCRKVLGPFTFDFTVPVEPTAPEYYDPEVQGPLAGLMIRFLDERLAYIGATDEEAARSHEARARAMLTPRYSAQVRDIGALDVPNQKSPDGSLQLAMQRWETDTLSASRASMPVRWDAGGELVIRRFHFQRVDGEWRISGIEPLTRDPQPSNYLGPDE